MYMYITLRFATTCHWRLQTVSEKWKSFHTETVLNKTAK